MGAVLAIRTLPAAAVESWETATDSALLEASSRRVQRAFTVLVSRYYKDVYRVVWRVSGGHADTEDITQETFMRLWAKPDQLREAKALKGWLLRVASNLVMDRFRHGFSSFQILHRLLAKLIHHQIGCDAKQPTFESPCFTQLVRL